MGVRDEVLRAALDCFTTEGYERTTIARIRERSGVSNGALFHHFPTKEAIAGALYVESIRSIQDGYRRVLERGPSTPREAIGGVIEQHLSWVERNPARARFLYAQGRLDWSTAAGDELRAMNTEVGGAYREFLTPFVERGTVRELPMTVLVAVITGPAHAVAQQWLAGQIPGSATAYLDELVDAAVAAVAVDPGPRRSTPARPVSGRVRIQLLDEAGAVLADGEAVTPLYGH
ncbi:TetR/AcrR family transcriptional regulator [Nocardia bovistercoris]|uniref:TetR/AcrR family transcriptional regulator n=1 Tax=Nocardia bovistercoris TaxID=2785916 RepID=A0A931N2J7_9NOCA|nr:TetR/AcrR family transcriptional regulator [Nocardia bovistercoris]MBH0776797.1 TetR/AcrR family transcriptional regulator [Nocardia bovistercoris]